MNDENKQVGDLLFVAVVGFIIGAVLMLILAVLANPLSDLTCTARVVDSGLCTAYVRDLKG